VAIFGLMSRENESMSSAPKPPLYWNSATPITARTSRTFRRAVGPSHPSVLELNRLYIAVSGKGKPDAKLVLQVFNVQP
jgi:hypothetical protein